MCGGPGTAGVLNELPGLFGAACAFVVIAMIGNLSDVCLRADVITCVDAAGFGAVECDDRRLAGTFIIVATGESSTAECSGSKKGGGECKRLRHFHNPFEIERSGFAWLMLISVFDVEGGRSDFGISCQHDIDDQVIRFRIPSRVD